MLLKRVHHYYQSSDNNDLINRDLQLLITNTQRSVREYLATILVDAIIQNVDKIFVSASLNFTSLINNQYNCATRITTITKTTTTSTTTKATTTTTSTTIKTTGTTTRTTTTTQSLTNTMTTKTTTLTTTTTTTTAASIPSKSKI